MPFCPNCGTNNDDNARFCQNCGRVLPDAASNDDAASTDRLDDRPTPVAGDIDADGRIFADDGLPVGRDLDGEPGGERILWEGRPNALISLRLALTTRYRLTNERLVIIHGFFSRRTEEIDLYRVNDVDTRQNFGERLVGIGDVSVATTDRTAPDVTILNVRDPDRVKDLVRAAARAERQRRRVLLRDEV